MAWGQCDKYSSWDSWLVLCGGRLSAAGRHIPAAHARIYQPVADFGCAVLFVCGIWMVARMYHGGAKLGIMMPLLAAVIPLGIIVIGIYMYGESASMLKIALLVGACGLIGAAASVS